MILSKANVLAFGILAIFATALAPAMGGDGRNFLVIAMAVAVPVLLLAFRLPLPAETSGVVVVLLYLVTISLARGTMSDLSTVMYTGLFALSYLGIGSCLETGLVSRQRVIRFLRFLILAFAVVSLLQMVTSLVGLPIPNRILSKGLWSYNSLSAEPSHLGRVLAISMLVYIVLLRGDPNVPTSPWQLIWHERKIVGAFLISIFLSGSTLAILAAPLALLFAFPARWTLLLSIALLFAWPLLILLDLPVLQRGLLFMTALPTMDVQALASSDHSASLRVAPALLYFDRMSFGSVGFWFGDGVSAIRPFFAGRLEGVGDIQGAGFFPGFLIAFGLVGFGLLVWVFVLRFLALATLPLIAFWTLLFLLSAWNSQLFWYGLILLRVQYHFEVGAGRRSAAVAPPRAPRKRRATQESHA